MVRTRVHIRARVLLARALHHIALHSTWTTVRLPQITLSLENPYGSSLLANAHAHMQPHHRGLFSGGCALQYAAELGQLLQNEQ
jgi:hypothetical protein